MTRFQATAGGVDSSPYRLVDQQLVEANGVEVVDAERTPETYADIQPTYATLLDRGDVVGVSDPLIGTPYILERGQLEHDAFTTPAIKRLLHVDQFGERKAVLALVDTHPHTRGEHS